MTRHLVLLAWLTFPGFALADSWIFQPSYFSHDPGGQRVAQYAPPQPAIFRGDPNYLQSGYRHNRISIRVGDTSDNLHIVETWGAGETIRPYGEWLRPFREGATPYGPWGNPQGPWTTPFGAWANPYGLGRLPNPPWWGYPGYASPLFSPAVPPGMPNLPMQPAPVQ